MILFLMFMFLFSSKPRLLNTNIFYVLWVGSGYIYKHLTTYLLYIYRIVYTFSLTNDETRYSDFVLFGNRLKTLYNNI